MTRPVRSRTRSSHPSRRSSSQRGAVRRSCQTMAGWTGLRVPRSQTTVVSRWLVMPTAATSPGATLASASTWCVCRIPRKNANRATTPRSSRAAFAGAPRNPIT